MVKWLKSPNSPNIEVVELKVAALGTIEETLNPRIEGTVLSRTQIVVTSKTTKPLLV